MDWVINTVHEWGGRFLVYDGRTGSTFEMNRESARKKVQSCFRAQKGVAMLGGTPQNERDVQLPDNEDGKSPETEKDSKVDLTKEDNASLPTKNDAVFFKKCGEELSWKAYGALYSLDRRVYSAATFH